MADSILKELNSSSLFDLTGVVAVVTGGGTGIGLMMTTTLIANGASTVFIIGPKQEDLDKIAKVYNDAAEKEGKPGRIQGIEGDISKKSEALRLADEIAKRAGHVTVLFNNAGITTPAITRPTEATAEAYVKAFFDPVTEAEFTNTHSTNAVGPYWLTFAFLPLLEKWKSSPGGQRFAPQIVMTSSMNGWTKDLATTGFSYPYMLSKAAIGQATSTLAHELLPLGIRVNGIAPGLFVTDMSSPGTIDSLGQSHPSSNVEWAFEIPVSRPAAPGGWRSGTNKDMGALVLFLVSNWFVDGETVLIDGGTLLRHPASY